MQYQTARSELQSPPAGIPLVAMALEVAAMLAAATIMVWLV